MQISAHIPLERLAAACLAGLLHLGQTSPTPAPYLAAAAEALGSAPGMADGERAAAARRWEMCGVAAERVLAWMSQVGCLGDEVGVDFCCTPELQVASSVGGGKGGQTVALRWEAASWWGWWEAPRAVFRPPQLACQPSLHNLRIGPPHLACQPSLTTCNYAHLSALLPTCSVSSFLQIRQRLWVRNGQQLLRLEAFYSSPYW